MLAQKQAEEAIVSNFNEIEHEGTREEVKESEDHSILSVKSILWHGGSAWDAWFSCASKQVAQVLLTLPYSFSQLGMLSGILFQIIYGLIGSWTAYLISVLYIEYRSRKEKENVNFKNHVIQCYYYNENGMSEDSAYKNTMDGITGIISRTIVGWFCNSLVRMEVNLLAY